MYLLKTKSILKKNEEKLNKRKLILLKYSSFEFIKHFLFPNQSSYNFQVSSISSLSHFAVYIVNELVTFSQEAKYQHRKNDENFNNDHPKYDFFYMQIFRVIITRLVNEREKK